MSTNIMFFGKIRKHQKFSVEKGTLSRAMRFMGLLLKADV